jgi:hypothetical protein
METTPPLIDLDSFSPPTSTDHGGGGSGGPGTDGPYQGQGGGDPEALQEVFGHYGEDETEHGGKEETSDGEIPEETLVKLLPLLAKDERFVRLLAEEKPTSIGGKVKKYAVDHFGTGKDTAKTLFGLVPFVNIGLNAIDAHGANARKKAYKSLAEQGGFLTSAVATGGERRHQRDQRSAIISTVLSTISSVATAIPPAGAVLSVGNVAAGPIVNGGAAFLAGNLVDTGVEKGIQKGGELLANLTAKSTRSKKESARQTPVLAEREPGPLGMIKNVVRGKDAGAVRKVSGHDPGAVRALLRYLMPPGETEIDDPERQKELGIQGTDGMGVYEENRLAIRRALGAADPALDYRTVVPTNDDVAQYQSLIQRKNTKADSLQRRLGANVRGYKGVPDQPVDAPDSDNLKIMCMIEGFLPGDEKKAKEIRRKLRTKENARAKEGERAEEEGITPLVGDGESVNNLADALAANQAEEGGTPLDE